MIHQIKKPLIKTIKNAVNKEEKHDNHAKNSAETKVK